MGTRDTYDQSLRELDQKILTMAGHAADAVEHAMDALENSNIEEAQAVIAGDDSIDREEHAIEHLCLGLIASQQPVASDLRKSPTWNSWATPPRSSQSSPSAAAARSSRSCSSC